MKIIGVAFSAQIDTDDPGIQEWLKEFRRVASRAPVGATLQMRELRDVVGFTELEQYYTQNIPLHLQKLATQLCMRWLIQFNRDHLELFCSWLPCSRAINDCDCPDKVKDHTGMNKDTFKPYLRDWTISRSSLAAFNPHFLRDDRLPEPYRSYLANFLVTLRTK